MSNIVGPDLKHAIIVVPCSYDPANPGTYTPITGSNGGILIPASDYVAYTYWTTTNNIKTATYKTGGSGGTTVATLTYAYVDATINDALLASITQS